MPLPKPFIVAAGNVAIGAVAFTEWDDGMAVANGVFRPTDLYDPRQHATELDGIKLGQINQLALTWADGRTLACELVTLVDWSKEAGEEFGREIAAYGVTDRNFWNGS